MSNFNNTISSMQSEAAKQASIDYFNKVDASSDKSNRNVGSEMGKSDFLMLLVTQLRYQNPLEPSNDSEFASQLAQYSSLEQMQNMNSSLGSMNNYQTYNLVGKFVMAEAIIDDKYEMITGVVDSIYMNNGITYAQIGEYSVPVASIKEVFDTNNILTSEMFMQTSAQLIGKVVVAIDGEDEIEGLVTRILVDRGQMLAQIDDGTTEPKFVPVNAIVDIREPGTVKFTPKPKTPPEAVNFKPDPESDGFIEYDEDLKTPIGRWDWDADQWKWIYTAYETEDEGGEIDDIGSGNGESEELDNAA